MTKFGEFLAETAALFEGAGIESFQADAETLVGFSLGISRGELQAKVFMGEEFKASTELQKLIERRAKREPLQHLTGFAHFRNLSLEVGPGVFIPRPETESVVSIALEFLRGVPNAKVLDIGTGSGAIAISIATEANVQVDAIELSEDAALFTRRNIDSSDAKVSLLVGDFREVELEFDSYNLVISNPPYIPLRATPLDPEVRDFDPELALYGG